MSTWFHKSKDTNLIIARVIYPIKLQGSLGMIGPKERLTVFLPYQTPGGEKSTGYEITRGSTVFIIFQRYEAINF